MVAQQFSNRGVLFNSKALTRYSVVLPLLVYTLFTSFPFFWTVATSLRPSNEVIVNPYGLPWPPTLQNYINIFTNPTLSYPRFFLNSVIVTEGALALTTFVATMAAFAFARVRYQFPLRE